MTVLRGGRGRIRTGYSGCRARRAVLKPGKTRNTDAAPAPRCESDSYGELDSRRHQTGAELMRIQLAVGAPAADPRPRETRERVAHGCTPGPARPGRPAARWRCGPAAPGACDAAAPGALRPGGPGGLRR